MPLKTRFIDYPARTLAMGWWFGILAACSGSGTTTEMEVAEKKSRPEATVAASDGVALAYDDRGEGETTLLLVHCWACDRSVWRGQIDALAREGYRVVSVDLGGHGASGIDREIWTLDQLADDVKSVADGLGLERVILLGHSMGGPVSLKAAALMPERVAGVVCADTLHDAEVEPPPEAMVAMAARYESDFEGTMREFMSAMFAGDVDARTVEPVLQMALAADPRVAVALLRDFVNLDLKQALSAVDVPIRCINAAPRGPGSPRTAVETNRKYADFDAWTLDGVGHFLMLEKPEEFNSRLLDLLAGFRGPRS